MDTEADDRDPDHGAGVAEDLTAALAATRRRTPGLRALQVVGAVLIGGGAIWLVVRAAGGLDDAFAAIEDMNLWWVVPAIVCEGIAYLLSGLRLRKLAGRPEEVTVVVATEVELVVNGLGLLTPASPAEGLALGGLELSRRGLGRRRAALSLAMSEWFSLQAFLLVSAVNLTWVVATRDFPIDATWPLLAAAAIVLALVASVVLASRPATTERLAMLLGRLPVVRSRRSPEQQRSSGARLHADLMDVVGRPSDRFVVAALSVGSLLADIACLDLLLVAAHARRELLDHGPCRGRGRARRRDPVPPGRARGDGSAHPGRDPLVRTPAQRRSRRRARVSARRHVPARRPRCGVGLRASAPARRTHRPVDARFLNGRATPAIAAPGRSRTADDGDTVTPPERPEKVVRPMREHPKARVRRGVTAAVAVAVLSLGGTGIASAAPRRAPHPRPRP